MSKLRDAFATQKEANRLAGYVQEWLETTDPTLLFKTCLTCNRCNVKTAFCNLYKVVPPVAVITGHTPCDAYQDYEDIPF